jgi:hypothetical protein
MSSYSYGARHSKDLNWVVVSVQSSNAPLPIFFWGKFSHVGNKKDSKGFLKKKKQNC